MRRKRRRRKKIRPFRLIIVLCIVLAGAYIASGFDFGEVDKEKIINFGDIGNEDRIIEEIDNSKYENTTINIAAVGDIMFHMSQIRGAYNEENDTYNFKEYFEPVKEIIESADIAIGNFEGTAAGNEKYTYKAWPIFNAPDEVLDAIKYAGFDILSTVNNHSIDTGSYGIVKTLEKIKNRGMDTVGTYAERPDSRLLIKDVKGIKIAFLAYTERCNGLESLLTEDELDYMINRIDRDKIKEDIDEAKEIGVDLIVAFFHWGNEYHREPSVFQKDLADYVLNEGVDIILGSHPHVIQDSKTLEYNEKKVFVAYSMGNFISNQRYETLSNDPAIPNSNYTEDGVIINFQIEKNGLTGTTEIKSINFTPTWVDRNEVGTVFYNGITNKRFDYRIYPIMEYIESEDIDEDKKNRMLRSYNDTMIKMNTNLQ